MLVESTLAFGDSISASEVEARWTEGRETAKAYDLDISGVRGEATSLACGRPALCHPAPLSSASGSPLVPTGVGPLFRQTGRPDLRFSFQWLMWHILPLPSPSPGCLAGASPCWCWSVF